MKTREVQNRKPISAGSALTLSTIALSLATSALAQDVHFDYSGEGETNAMTHWGVDTAWPSYDNVRQSIFHMGKDQVDVVRVNFYMFEPLVGCDENYNGCEIGPESKARIDAQLQLAAMAGDKPLALTPATGEWLDFGGGVQGPTHPWYLSDENGNLIDRDNNGAPDANPHRWLALMEATQEYIGKPIHSLEIFNEPDFWLGMGPPETLLDISNLTLNSPNFAGTELHAASTLCSCTAWDWYNVAKDPTTHGTLHQLASWWGNASDNYINFINYVQSQGDIAYNDELHSMLEVLHGAEYGMLGGIWWADVLLPRGKLINAVQGKRLGYAENRGANSAAAVYRAPDGETYGFAGSYERVGDSHSQRLVSDTQDLFFDGMGPLRTFSVSTWADPQGGFIDIDNAPGFPSLDGHRWKIVNRASGEVLEVDQTSDGDDASGNGQNIRTATDSDADNQKWDITRDRSGYYHIINADSGKSMDDYAWSLDNGGSVKQWDNYGSLNQSWWIKAKNQGYFYIHNGHSNLYVESDASSDNVQQWEFTGKRNQQWSFVQADTAGSLVARYEFEGDANDSSGNANNGTANLGQGGSYVAGEVGSQAIHLNGGWDWWGDHVELPADILADKDDITLAAWVYWEGGDAYQRIFDFGTMDPYVWWARRYMFLTPSSDTGEMKFSITTDNWWGEQTLVAPALPTNQWVHVALTLGGNTAELYVNGVLQTAGYLFKNPSDLFTPSTESWLNWQPRNFIGRSQWPDPTFRGSIDEFQIYDYAVSAKEIGEMMPELVVLEDSFEGNLVKWANYDANYWDNTPDAGVDTKGWETSSSEWISGQASAHRVNGSELKSRDIDTSGRNEIYVQFWFKDQSIDGKPAGTLEFFNGSNWKTIATLSGNEGDWNFFSTTVSDDSFMKSDFKLKFKSSQDLYIDDVMVKAIQ